MSTKSWRGRGRDGRKAWLIALRKPDGALLYFAEDTDRGGDPAWSPRRSQAKEFDTRDEAEVLAATFETNSFAKEYSVVRG